MARRCRLPIFPVDRHPPILTELSGFWISVCDRNIVEIGQPTITGHDAINERLRRLAGSSIIEDYTIHWHRRALRAANCYGTDNRAKDGCSSWSVKRVARDRQY